MANTLVIRDVTLIDGTGAPPVERATIVIDGDRIASVGQGAAGPRLLFTGPMIDGDPPTWPTLNRATPDAEGAARAVEEHLAAGADAIKLYTTLEPGALRRR